MADPATAAQHAASLQGQAAAIPLASITASVLGIPLDLLGWAMFGGLVAEAYAEPRQPPLPHPATVARIALHLSIAAGLGGVFAPLGVDIVAALAAKYAGITLAADANLARAMAVAIGFSTAFIPEGVRLLRARLQPTGGTQ